jgi:hypothetical protein
MGAIIIIFICVQLLHNYNATINAHANNFSTTTLPPHDRTIQLLCKNIATLMTKQYNFSVTILPLSWQSHTTLYN